MANNNSPTDQPPKISVILPCRNEEASLAACLEQIQTVLANQQINGEIIVSDSSIDRSPEIARKLGAILVKHDQVGYGRAYLEAFPKASGKYLFMADPDGSYDFGEIPYFLNYLETGYDLVIGNRFAYPLARGVMPWSHQHIGNPLLSSLFRWFFDTTIKDVHCGMRALSREALERLNLQAPGMEFASEMLIEAAAKQLKIKQVPISYRPRQGQSKLKTLPDGWRHLKLMLRRSL
jgi:glycosyltransferase involved in cell wall biosynthesis